MAYGTLQVLDTLASSQQTIAAYGEDRAFEEIERARQIHNDQVRDMLTAMCELTTDRQRRYGSADAMTMDEIDEFGTPDAQKITAGVTVGFPLRLFGTTVQWTRKYMQTHRANELAAQFTAVMDADLKLSLREIKRAFFYPTNVSFLDRLVDNVTLAVKRLVNADSAAIPIGPNGEEFNGASHTHYLYTASTSIAAADLAALVLAVSEHTATGTIMVAINTAQEAAVRALQGFVAVTDARLVLPGGYTTVTGGPTLDLLNVGNRHIGYFGVAEVWTKPWVPAGYLAAWIGEIAQKPLVLRERAPGSGGLVIAAEDESHPLRARILEREFGVGVWNRVAGAALYIDTGAASAYVAPTLS